MKIEYTRIYENELDPDDDLINEVLSTEIIDDNVLTLVRKLQKFADNFPEAIVDNEYLELTIRADVDDNLTYYMMVTTKEEESE